MSIGTASVVYEPVCIGPVDPIPDFYLPHGNITSVTLYYYMAATPEVIDLFEGVDYDCDYASGLITGLDTSWGYLDPGDIIYADYTYIDTVTSLQTGDSLLAYYNYTESYNSLLENDTLLAYYNYTIFTKPMYFALRGMDELGRFGDIASASNLVAKDNTAPGKITNFTVETGVLHGMVFLNFTSSGDDGPTGTVKRYILRYSNNTITSDAEFDAASDWQWANPYFTTMLPELA
jgi:hypothetical protein